jgi:predicted nucleic acid-binding protein
MADARHVDAAQVLTSKQVTDTFLLALTVAHGGKLATFDRRLSAKAALHVIIGSSGEA